MVLKRSKIKQVQQPNEVQTAILQKAFNMPLQSIRALLLDDLLRFIEYFWDVYSAEELVINWHMRYLCDELMRVADNVGHHRTKEYDLIINIAPGSSKTSIVNVFFPVWCWVKWYAMKFITGSYTSPLALESAEHSRDIIKSEKFQQLFPEIGIKQDKDVKSNFRVVKKLFTKLNRQPRIKNGGTRLSTSVGGASTGFHAHIIIIDDPLNPEKSYSRVELEKANRWIGQTLSTRKVNKRVSVMILIMQRLHENDPTGYLLKKAKKTRKKIKHICIPGELGAYKKNVKPAELILKYKDGLMDPNRLDRNALADLKTDLGQYGYAGQIGQQPTPPGGGMFHYKKFQIITQMPSPVNIVAIVRFWDKAGTKDGGAYSAGVKIAKLRNGKYVVMDVRRGQWGSNEREDNIENTARADVMENDITETGVEQEPGSGGKESAENTIRRLAGLRAYKESPKGDKIYRADPWSVAVNNGDVMLLHGDWNHEYIEEHKYFPYSTYKDQVDASGAAYSRLNNSKNVKVY